MPIVSRELAVPMLFPLGDGDEFEKAREKVEELISSVGMNSGLSAESERQVLARFNAFGRSLVRTKPLSSRLRERRKVRCTIGRFDGS